MDFWYISGIIGGLTTCALVHDSQKRGEVINVASLVYLAIFWPIGMFLFLLMLLSKLKH